VFNSSQFPEGVYQLALACAFTFGKGAYGVGWDGRKSSYVLARATVAGISAAGSSVKSFGMVPTPVTAYGAREGGCKLGFSVTASHNPPEYSGVKIFDSQGMELSKERESRIERVMAVEVDKSARNYGPISDFDYLEQYVVSMVERFDRAKDMMKIAVDCVNGPGAFVTPRVLQALGHKVIPLNAQVSWRFPARTPEPTPQTLTDTAAIVAACGADFGFAHDGDADRLVMINAAGRVLPDSTVSIIALRALARSSGAVVLSENTSSAVEEEAVKLGLRVVRSRIGKTFAEIEKEGAFFATEPSKVVNPDWGMWEDGMYCAALIADSISRDRKLLELLDSEPAWHYRQVNLHASPDFAKLVARAEEEFGKFRISEVRQLDGLKLVFEDQSWIMFRASGTEPKVRIYCESRDQVRLEELLDTGRRLLEEESVQRVG
jgi:phosphomannomutase